MPTLLWFRRDLRLHDLPPLLDAAQADGEVLACYVLDPRLKASSGARRLQYLYDSLRELRDGLDGRLLVTRGRPETRIPALAKRIECDVGTRVGRLLPLRRAPRQGSPRRVGRPPARRLGLAVPRLPRSRDEGRRHPLQGVHAVLLGMARARLAGTGQDRTEVGDVDRSGRRGRRHRHSRRRRRTRTTRW